MAYTTIDDPSAYFKMKLFTGTESSHAITFDDTDTNMQPDLIWIKSRADTNQHYLSDSVRGTGKEIYSSLPNAEVSDANGVTAFGSNGFTLGSNTGVNGSSDANIAWCWKASGSTASNTDGTNITSTVSANTTSGFSIVSWTGDNSGSSTVGHGLGKTAEFVVIKNRADSANWQVKHKNNSANASQSLDAVDAESSRAGSTNGGIADLSGTTTFGFIAGSAGVPAANGASDAMIAYVWNSVQGFSKFGKYTGNGNADGPFCYCGFLPSYLMIKKISAGDNWFIQDSTRSPFNVIDDYFVAQSTAVEGTGNSAVNVDFLSNGFKIRNTDSGFNSSGGTYIFIAFAKAPLVNSSGVSCNAR